MTPYLPDDVARCRPHPHCERAATCGRALAAMPERGASLINGMVRIDGMACQHYIAASDCVPPATPGRPVHPAW